MLYIYYENIVFKEIVNELYQCCLKLGIQATCTNLIKSDNFLDLYIIFGMNDFNSTIIPNNYIVYQLEQTSGNEESHWFSNIYINYLKNAISVWDYSLVNYQNLEKLGIKNICYVPIQYLYSVDKIIQKPYTEKDIDILFIGSFNQRRQKIIDELTQKGYIIVAKNNSWNEERNDLISRAKLIINIHYFETSILESVRLSLLLSNKCCVISETSLDPILDKWHSNYLQLVKYDQLVESCCQFLSLYPDNPYSKNLDDYKKYSFMSKLPLIKIKDSYPYLINMIKEKPFDEKLTENIENEDPTKNKKKKKINDQNELQIEHSVNQMDSSDLFQAEYEINENKEIILKLPKLSYEELPHVSIITVTYNRKNIFPLAIRNWELFEYPRDKLEWIIVDDSENGDNLTDILPKSKEINYFKLKTTGRLSIGQKRNFGIENAKYEYIAFMDDDDYYPQSSIYARIALLLKYKQYDLVGVTDLDIYDIVNDFSARITNRPFVSEASMAFKKSFWKERKFPAKFSTLGEGHPFLKNRRNRVIKMPSCFNIIAMTHSNNYTMGRSHSMFKETERKGNILATIDLSSRLFIYSLFDKIKYNEDNKKIYNEDNKKIHNQ